ncbi:hypothetical protein [Azospirillum argentinense]
MPDGAMNRRRAVGHDRPGPFSRDPVRGRRRPWFGHGARGGVIGWRSLRTEVNLIPFEKDHRE